MLAAAILGTVRQLECAEASRLVGVRVLPQLARPPGKARTMVVASNRPTLGGQDQGHHWGTVLAEVGVGRGNHHWAIVLGTVMDRGHHQVLGGVVAGGNQHHVVMEGGHRQITAPGTVTRGDPLLLVREVRHHHIMVLGMVTEEGRTVKNKEDGSHQQRRVQSAVPEVGKMHGSLHLPADSKAQGHHLRMELGTVAEEGHRQITVLGTVAEEGVVYESLLSLVLLVIVCN